MLGLLIFLVIVLHILWHWFSLSCLHYEQAYRKLWGMGTLVCQGNLYLFWHNEVPAKWIKDTFNNIADDCAKAGHLNPETCYKEK